jgi:hypothetical protein
MTVLKKRSVSEVTHEIRDLSSSHIMVASATFARRISSPHRRTPPRPITRVIATILVCWHIFRN